MKEIYAHHYGEQIHSLWLRGSLPRGFMVDGFSDLDIFALIENEEDWRWETVPWLSEIEGKLLEKYPFVQELDCNISSYTDNFLIERPALAMLIKTQSLCLLGWDICQELKYYKPGVEMALHYRWIKEDVEHFLNLSELTVSAVRTICKQMIRTLFELVMERMNEYTPDLYWCCWAFSDYYPERKEAAFQLLKWYVRPELRAEKVKPFIEEFGNWTINNANKAFKHT